MLAFGPDGYLYTADRLLTGDVYKIAADGTHTTFGNVPGREPWGMAFDSRGNLYIADNTSNVFKYTSSGARSTFASNLADPLSIAIDRNDNIYVGVFYTGEIRKFNTNGTSSVFATGIADPLCLAFAPDGNLFESDGATPASIKRFAYVGSTLRTNPTTFAPGLDYPYGLAFAPADLPVRPTLFALKTNGVVRVTWSSSFGGWTLNKTASLASAGAAWSVVSPELLFTNGSEISFTVSQPTNNCYFRLSKP